MALGRRKYYLPSQQDSSLLLLSQTWLILSIRPAMTSHSEWGFETTASEVADTFAEGIRGRTILITGVSLAGLGGMTAKALAAHVPRLLT